MSDDNIVPFKGKEPPPPEDDGDDFFVCPECGHFGWLIYAGFRIQCESPFCDFESDLISQE